MEAKKEKEEKQYKDFCENLKTVLKKNPDDKTMHHVELVKTSFTYYEKQKSFTCITMNLIFFPYYLYRHSSQ